MSKVVFPIAVIAKAIKAQASKALPGDFDGYILAGPKELLANGATKAFTVMPEPVTYDPSEEMDLAEQEEHWPWTVYLALGKGSDAEETLDDVEKHLGALQSVLVGFEAEQAFGASGAIERISAGFFGFAPNGAIYGFRFHFQRYTGEQP